MIGDEGGNEYMGETDEAGGQLEGTARQHNYVANL